MKFNITFLFLFLIQSITSEIDLDSYSIETFKEDLKRKGLYEIIESIYKAYKQDVAIISCEELVGNRKGNCKRLVTEYINPSDEDIASTFNQDDAGTRGIENYHIKCIKRLYHFLITNSKIIKHSLVIKGELRKKYPEDLSNLIFNKIVKRVRDLGVCEE